jgi:hypothetical protein
LGDNCVDLRQWWHSNSVMGKPRQRSAAQITACGHKGATLQHPAGRYRHRISAFSRAQALA